MDILPGDWELFIVLAIGGWFVKILDKMILAQSGNPEASFTGYIRDDRFRVALSWVGITIGLIVLESTGQLNEAAAVFAGFFSESIARTIRSMGKGKFPGAE